PLRARGHARRCVGAAARRAHLRALEAAVGAAAFRREGVPGVLRADGRSVDARGARAPKGRAHCAVRFNIAIAPKTHFSSQAPRYNGVDQSDDQSYCLGMASWQVQDAKARFSELLDATLKKGPQIVTRRGVEMVAL